MNRAVFAPDSAAPLGSINQLLLARARYHVVKDFPGPLSIKHVIDGRIPWKTGARKLWVDETSFLVLDDRQPYSLEIEKSRPVETCCVFFKRGYVESVARVATTPEGELLDDPYKPPASLSFISRLHRDGTHVIPILLSLRGSALRGGSGIQMEESFLALARVLIGTYDEILAKMRRVPAAKASTREELFRRIERGREYMHACVDTRLTLEEMARAACLSPFHFHRVFARTYHETPHSYLSKLRLTRASKLLETGLSVTEVCGAVGFESLGSFSALFRKRFGHAPSGTRKFARFEKPLPPD